MKPYPSKKQQLKNLVKTASQVARDPRLVSKEEGDRRRKICNTCEYFDKDRNRCKKCGCALKAKIAFKSARCPLNKWRKNES